MDTQRVGQRHGRWAQSPRRAALDFLRRWYGLEEMHRHMALIMLPLDAEDDDVEEGTHDWDSF